MRIPPDLSGKEKQELILRYQKKYGFKTLVETGTFEGNMINATKGVFREVYSIEMVDEFYKNAVERFKDDANVHLLNGNSGDLISRVLSKISDSVLFWLDAHDGLQSPVMKELQVIFSFCYDDHLILIDDMRNFDHRSGYPNIKSIEDFVKGKWPCCRIEICDDIMRIGNAI